MKANTEDLNQLIEANTAALVWLPQAETQNEFLTRGKKQGYEFTLLVIIANYNDPILMACTKDKIFDCMTALSDMNLYAKMNAIDDALLIYK